jgi:hypothetical protein
MSKNWEDCYKQAKEEFIKDFNILDMDQVFCEMPIVDLAQMKQALVTFNRDVFFDTFRAAIVRQNQKQIDERAEELSRDSENYKL